MSNDFYKVYSTFYIKDDMINNKVIIGWQTNLHGTKSTKPIQQEPLNLANQKQAPPILVNVYPMNAVSSGRTVKKTQLLCKMTRLNLPNKGKEGTVLSI